MKIYTKSYFQWNKLLNEYVILEYGAYAII